MSKYILDFEAPLRELEEKIESLHSTNRKTGVDVSSGIKQLEVELVAKKATIYENLSRWERVQLARHPKRPYTSDYIERVVDDWIELHGDRYFSDDTAIIGGIGKIDGQPFIIIGNIFVFLLFGNLEDGSSPIGDGFVGSVWTISCIMIVIILFFPLKFILFKLVNFVYNMFLSKK